MLPPFPPPTRRTEAAAQPSGDSFLAPKRLGPTLTFGRGERFEVRVALAFFLLAAAPGIAGGAARMATCAAIVFSAALAHELGHAACALLYGSRVAIVLHALGAHTQIEPGLSPGRELVTTLGGPVVSVAIGGLLFVLHGNASGHSWLAIASFVNLGWGAINLLPVLPFDGGRAVLTLVGDRRRALALLISGTFALVIAVEGLVVLRSAPIIFLFGAAAVASLFAWAKLQRVELELGLGLPRQLEQARCLLGEGKHEHARQLALRVGAQARGNGTANQAWHVAAWAELGLGLPELAHEALCRVRPTSEVETYCLAAVQAALGETRHAIGLLERVSPHELDRDAAKLLIDLNAALGSFDRACSVAGAALAVLGPDDTRRVIEAAFEADAISPATKLAGELFAVTASLDDAVSHAYGLARLGDRTTAKRIFVQLVSLLSNWQMHRATLARLRDLAARPGFSELIGPELSDRALATASRVG